MNCPNCGQELPAKASACDRCLAPISRDSCYDEETETLEPGGATDLVRAYECLGLADAELFGRALDVAGVPFFLNNENMASLFPGAMGGISGLGLGRVAIMVPVAFVDQAKHVIDDAIRNRDRSTPEG